MAGRAAAVVLVLAVKACARGRKMLLPVMIGVIALYWFTQLDPRVYTYLIVAVALIALVVGSYSQFPKLRLVTSLFAAGMMVVNLFLYDIGGRFTDPHHSAEMFRQELTSIPPNSIVWTYNRGWEAMTVELYDFDHGTTFNTVLMAHARQDAIEDMEAAYAEGRLYRTVIVDPASYLVKLERTTPERVKREADEQDLSQYQRK